MDRKKLEYAISYPPHTVLGYCCDRVKELGWEPRDNPSIEELLEFHEYWQEAMQEIKEFKKGRQ